MADLARVAIAAGGTAGHINPALALAEELRERGAKLSFVGQSRRLEGTLVPAAGFDFMPIEVSGFDRSRPWTAVTALSRMRRAERVLRQAFASQSQTPEVVIGFGAYVELPLVRWARRASVPIVLHEQNSVPGLANKLCARHATEVCVAFPAAKDAFLHNAHVSHVEVTGNPVRRSVLNADRTQARLSLGIGDDEMLLLVFGGSLGARHVNEGIVALKEDLLARPRLHVLHATGKDEFDAVAESLALTGDEAKRWSLVPYIDFMGDALAAADLVVSRAGASSVAEIAAARVPSILVPYPLATADHQTMNAALLTDAGAALKIADDDIDNPVFKASVLSLIDEPNTRNTMRLAATKLQQDKAAVVLADVVQRVVRG